MKRGMFKVIATALSALLIAGVVFYLVSSQDDLDELERIHSNWASWPTVTGIITSAKTNTESAPNGEEYFQLHATFTYQIQGIRYTNTQWWYAGSLLVDEKYAPFAPFAVYYDPADPQISIIEPSLVPERWVSTGLVYVPTILRGLLGCALIWGLAYDISQWLARRRNTRCVKS